VSESQDPGKPIAALPEVPTKITSGQVIATLLIVAALYYGKGLLAPLLVAVLVSVSLAPLVRVLARAMPRGLASGLVVAGIAGVLGLTAYTLSDEVVVFSRQLPQIIREVRATIASASPRQGLIRQIQQAMTELEKTAASAPAANATPVTIVAPVDVQREMMSGVGTIAGYLAQGILMMFLIYFLLASGDFFKQQFVKLGGSRLSQRKVTHQMIDEITEKIGRFVVYQVWSGAVVGGVTWLAFAWMGVRYAGLWGVAAGVLNCVPYFGPTLILGASAVAALIQFQSLTMMALVALVSVVITALEGFLLAPVMLGHAARVNTVAVFVAIMFWGWIWGSLGLVVAVPILMIVKTVADHVESLSTLSALLSDRR
jgi:predicted PurR-regulated permease PerM